MGFSLDQMVSGLIRTKGSLKRSLADLYGITGHPDPDVFTESLVLGNGGTLISRTGTNPVDPLEFETDGSYNGLYNTFAGVSAGGANTTGNMNCFVGTRAGKLNVNGDQCTFVGCMAGEFNTSGYHNTFIGVGAGQSNTTGYHNTYVGCDCGLHITTGHSNAFFGTSAGTTSTSGDCNTFVGGSAGYGNVSGSNNVCIGTGSGYGAAVAASSNNIFIGYQTTASTDVTNATAIGYEAQATKSNQVVLGNASVTETLLRGAVIVTSVGSLQLKSSAVAHGITDYVETDVFFDLLRADATLGGTGLRGFSDGDGIGLTCWGVIGTATPTAALPAINFLVAKKNGATIQNLAATETAIRVENRINTIFTLLAGGNAILGSAAAVGTNATNTVMVSSGVAPASSPADAFQMYSADAAAGNACPTFRTEGGTVIKLYQPATLTQTYSTADATLADWTPDDESAAYTTVGAGGDIASMTELNALRAAYENLRAAHTDLAAFVNSLVDSLQLNGLVG